MICEWSELVRVKADFVPEPLELLGERQKMDLGPASMVEQAIGEDEAHDC